MVFRSGFVLACAGNRCEAFVNGNFDSTAYLIEGDSAVAVGGWLTWDLDDTGCTVSVTITQDGWTASGVSEHYTAGTTKWDATVYTGGGAALKPGPALAQATVTTFTKTGDVRPGSWSQPVELR